MNNVKVVMAAAMLLLADPAFAVVMSFTVDGATRSEKTGMVRVFGTINCTAGEEYWTRAVLTQDPNNQGQGGRDSGSKLERDTTRVRGGHQDLDSRL